MVSGNLLNSGSTIWRHDQPVGHIDAGNGAVIDPELWNRSGMTGINRDLVANKNIG